MTIGVTAGGGPTMRNLVRALVHRNRGYLVQLAVPDAMYAQASQVYDQLFEGFEHYFLKGRRRLAERVVRFAVPELGLVTGEHTEA